jgi:hypothetical protein
MRYEDYDYDYAEAMADAAQERWDNDYAETKWQCLEEWWAEALAKFAEEQPVPFGMEHINEPLIVGWVTNPETRVNSGVWNPTYEAAKGYEPFTDWFFEKYADDIEEALKENYYNAAD